LQSRLAEQLDSMQATLQDAIPRLGETNTAAFDRFAPLLGRIELYSMTAARRIAVRCGADALMIRTEVGYVLCPDQDHALIARLVETGDLEPGTRQLIQRILTAGDAFVDVGANIGMHTIAAARCMAGQGRVIAVEPHPLTASLLQRSAWMNGFAGLVQVHVAAAAGKPGERMLHIGPTSGHHSLFPLTDGESRHTAPIAVQATTLDKILPANLQITLLKIDAEGAEVEIMGGAARTLKRNKHMGIIAEFGGSHLRRTGTQAEAWLASFTSHGFDYRAIQADDGSLRRITVEELDTGDSINLFFARPGSPLWQKVM
jgi:FkbM family methyltransferase